MTTRYSHHPTPSPSPDLPPTKGPGQTGARDASCLEPLVVSFLFFKCIYSTNRSLLIDCTYEQQTTPSLTLTRSRSKGWVGVGDRARYVFFLLNSFTHITTTIGPHDSLKEVQTVIYIIVWTLGMVFYLRYSCFS